MRKQHSEIMLGHSPLSAPHCSTVRLQTCSKKWAKATIPFWMSVAKEISAVAEEEEDFPCYLEYRNLEKKKYIVSRGNEKKKI